MPDDDYPYVLNTGRLRHQWHPLTKTGRVARLNKLNPGPFVEVHPQDAAELGLADADPVEVASRRGRDMLPAVITDRQKSDTPLDTKSKEESILRASACRFGRSDDQSWSIWNEGFILSSCTAEVSSSSSKIDGG
jgi:anaerobic selenocysteine-containing dehydrogenase